VKEHTPYQASYTVVKGDLSNLTLEQKEQQEQIVQDLKDGQAILSDHK
jgi:hypothetical protein